MQVIIILQYQQIIISVEINLLVNNLLNHKVLKNINTELITRIIVKQYNVIINFSNQMEKLYVY